MNWTSIKQRLLSGYDPDRHARQPMPTPDTDNQRTTPRRGRIHQTDSLRPDKRGKVTIAEQVAESTWQWQSASFQTDYGQRMAVLTPEERHELRHTRGLFEDKAEQLKILWAANYSARQAADQIGEYGFGERTVKTYWALFNRHAGTPGNPPKKKARPRKKAE